LAIYHLSMKPISRASGRSAVASAAYRAGESLTNERDGLTHDFTRRQGVEHCEIGRLHKGQGPEWAWTVRLCGMPPRKVKVVRMRGWAREFEIALPYELMRTGAGRSHGSSRRGWRIGTGRRWISAIHAPHAHPRIKSGEDGRNFHAHLNDDDAGGEFRGLGDKTAIERENNGSRPNNLR